MVRKTKNINWATVLCWKHLGNKRAVKRKWQTDFFHDSFSRPKLCIFYVPLYFLFIYFATCIYVLLYLCLCCCLVIGDCVLIILTCFVFPFRFVYIFKLLFFASYCFLFSWLFCLVSCFILAKISIHVYFLLYWP